MSLWSVPHIIPPSCKLQLLSLILALVWLWAWRSCYLQSINEPPCFIVVRAFFCESRIRSSMKLRLLLYRCLLSFVYIKPQNESPASLWFFSSLFRLLCLYNCLFCSVQAKSSNTIQRKYSFLSSFCFFFSFPSSTLFFAVHCYFT